MSTVGMLDFHPEQLDVGLEISLKLGIIFAKIEDTINQRIENVISEGKNNHVDLTEHFYEKDKIHQAINDLLTEVELMNNLAKQEYELFWNYSQGVLGNADDILDSGFTVEEYVTAQASSYVAYLYPDKAGRILASLGMAGFKFGEGFAGFFEGLADGAISVAGATCTFVGADKTGEKLQETADYDFVVGLFENSDAYRYLDRNSYFRGDSDAARLFYSLGETTGATVTAQGVGKFFDDAKKGKDILATYQKVGNSASNFNGTYQDMRTAGFTNKDAVLVAAAVAGAEQVLTSGSKKLGTKVGNKTYTIATGNKANAGKATTIPEKAYNQFKKNAQKVAGNIVNDTLEVVEETTLENVDTSNLSDQEQAVLDASLSAVDNAADTFVKNTASGTSGKSPSSDKKNTDKGGKK